MTGMLMTDTGSTVGAAYLEGSYHGSGSGLTLAAEPGLHEPFL
jgi:hypothetical protein